MIWKVLLLVIVGTLPAAAHVEIVNGEIVDYNGYQYRHENGTLNSCCNNTHCRQLTDGDANPVPGGYWIQSLKRFVPNSLAQPGPNQHYHVCLIDKKLRCFLVPGPGV